MLTTDTSAGLVARSGADENEGDMKIIKIKIIRPTVAAGKDVFPGDVVDVSEQDARLLCNIGKAVPFVEEEKVEPASAEEVAEAIEQLDLDSKDDFTSGGKPRVEALERVIGKPVDSAMRDDAWKAFEE